MALHRSLLLRCSTLCPTEEKILRPSPLLSSLQPIFFKSNRISCPSSNACKTCSLRPNMVANSLKKLFRDKYSDDEEEEEDTINNGYSVADDPYLMSEDERLEMRKKIREVLDMNPHVKEEKDPEQVKIKIKKLVEDYELVVEEDKPDWPEDADGWGFKFDQFFNNIRIKNVRKDDDDDDYEDIVWQDDDYIKPIRDITTTEWEDTVFKDFNPCIILVHNRYKRPRENVRARDELEKAVKVFWETGLPSPRCVAVDAIVEDELAGLLQVSIFPEIIFTKAGKILHRDNVVRSADEWLKMMAFFYYKAVRPPFLDEAAGMNQEKIPSMR
ncbi:hypothetical protein HPP92_013537 [Vanilla planifolia]|uniref:Thioredoxin-like fold domain-containing protein MRL7L, chloroplastic n=1 Tax=Vanilla planifolia TaxID=51239 RepID=A0A835UYR6_VANPL|nr:hypothetical protein HPP92_013537 [Vanilla planifolia]